MHVVVMLNSGSSLTGVEQLGDETDFVKETVQRLLEAEGQGSFVIETDEGWACVPTRSIDYVLVVRSDA